MDSSLKVIHVADGVNGYVDLVRHVFAHGEETSPRGLLTREIEDATIFIDNVYATLPTGVGRGVTPGIGAVEACQLLGGVSRPKTVVAVGPQFEKYAEDDGAFYGSYGLRTVGQYESVVKKLKDDSDTRQAVVTIWDPARDNEPNKRDYPCTVLHQFRIRNNKLNMSVYMRSNDVWLGAAYDFFQFTRVQIALAWVLGIEPGTYGHHVGSLHIYESNFAAAENLTYTSKVEAAPVIVGSTWAEVQERAVDVLDAVVDRSMLPTLSESQRWYADAMVKAIDKNAS